MNEDPMLEEWIMAAIMGNLPKQVTTDLDLERKKGKSIDDIDNSTNIYMHDHQVGMPRHMPGPMLHVTEQGSKHDEPHDTTQEDIPHSAELEKSKVDKSNNSNAKTIGISTLLVKVGEETAKVLARERGMANVGTVVGGGIRGGNVHS